MPRWACARPRRRRRAAGSGTWQLLFLHCSKWHRWRRPSTVSSRATLRPAMMARPPASNVVRSEWLRRVEAEYRSAALTQHLTLWLIQVGASPDLVRAGLRIVRDEMTHAAMS